jgi:hypothetical protein
MMEKRQPLQQMLLGNGYLPVENWNLIHAYHPVLVSTQSGLNMRPEALK